MITLPCPLSSYDYRRQKRLQSRGSRQLRKKTARVRKLVEDAKSSFRDRRADAKAKLEIKIREEYFNAAKEQIMKEKAHNKEHCPKKCTCPNLPIHTDKCAFHPMHMKTQPSCKNRIGLALRAG